MTRQREKPPPSLISCVKKAFVVLCGLFLVLTIRFFPLLSAKVKDSLSIIPILWNSREQFPPHRELPLVAGVPIDEAWKIVERHEKELKKTPGVEGLFVGKDEILIQIIVYTDDKGEKPAQLPARFQALPTTLEGIPVRLIPIDVFPPPPGVIVLKPGGKRESADKCPTGYDETSLYGWRFCYAHGNPETIPGVMMPPIGGIPSEEAYKILERHRGELMALPGVGAVGMGATGISIETDNPSILPKDVEGLPLEIRPMRKGVYRQSSHTATTVVRPLRGGIGIGLSNAGSGTLTGMAYSGGGLWLIFPAHLLAANQCNFDSPCPSTLDTCLVRYKSTNATVNQPFSFPAPTQKIGQVVRWTNNQPGTSVYDVAAAWMDNDLDQGNSSLCADQTVNEFGYWSGQDVDTNTLRPGLTTLTLYTINSTATGHKRTVIVSDVDMNVPGIATHCGSGGTVTHLNQVKYTAPNFDLADGDSGSPVLTSDGKFVAMAQWAGKPDGYIGGGILGTYIKSVLGFSKWYGTATFLNNPLICQ